jgi:hypothetical protein
MSKNKREELDTNREEENNVSEDFKKKVMKFLEYDDQIKEYQKKIKEIKNKKDECEEYILDNLDKLDTNMIEVKGCKLVKNHSETKKPCNSDMIKQTIEEEINDYKKAKKIMEKLENKRESKERIFLKRTTGKVKKTK